MERQRSIRERIRGQESLPRKTAETEEREKLTETLAYQGRVHRSEKAQKNRALARWSPREAKLMSVLRAKAMGHTRKKRYADDE